MHRMFFLGRNFVSGFPNTMADESPLSIKRKFGTVIGDGKLTLWELCGKQESQ